MLSKYLEVFLPGFFSSGGETRGRRIGIGAACRKNEIFRIKYEYDAFL